MDFVVTDPAYAHESPPQWCDPFSDTVASGSTNDKFLVTTCNSSPTPSLSILTTTTPPPPLWVSLQDNGDGTGTLKFNAPTVASQTSYSFTLVATNVTNGVTNQAKVVFTITVDVPAAIVSPSNGAIVPEPQNFAILVATSGTGPMFLTESDNAPSGTTKFTDNGDGTGSLVGTAVTAGSYTVTFSAVNPVGAATPVTITVNVTSMTNPVAGIMFIGINASGGSNNCASQTISTSITCTATGLGNGGHFNAQVELVNSSGQPVTNTGSPITVTCSLTGSTGVVTTTVSGSPQQIATSASSTPSAFSLSNSGTGNWSGSMQCSATISGTTYTITVTGSH